MQHDWNDPIPLAQPMQTHPDLSPSRPISRWQRAFSGIRTRILTWYILLMSVSMLVAVLGIRQTLLTRLYERIEVSLGQEVQEFRQLVDGRDPETGEPFGANVEAILSVFLQRNIPADGEFLIMLLNGKFYRSSPSALPDALEPTTDLVRSLAQLTQPDRQWVLIPGGDTIIYQAEPIIRGNNRGVFVVAYLPSQGRREIDEAMIVIVQVTLGVLVVASVVAWVAAGRAMAPLSLLTEAVRTVSESDLTRRIPVQGADEISELTRRFNEMLDRLQAAFNSQRDFISDAGHELRTPITIIRGHLELMGNDPHEQQETLAIVTDELNRMNRFVDDLLLLAKAEQQRFLKLDLVDVAALTDELFAKAKALADRQWRLDAKGTGRIVADRQRLTQAVMNLAQNATQHTHSTDSITIGSALKGGYAWFWVQDTGEGIAESDQQRIFERFARAMNSHRRSEGAGLGLAIVKAIALAHGGSVDLISQPGKGSTFTLVIPIDPV